MLALTLLLALYAPLPFHAKQPEVLPGKYVFPEGAQLTLYESGGEYVMACGFRWKVISWSINYDRKERCWYVGLQVVDPITDTIGFAQFRRVKEMKKRE